MAIKIFVKPKNGRVEELNGDTFGSTISGDVNRIQVSRQGSSVGVSVERASEGAGQQEHSTLTPKKPSTKVAGVKIRATFSP